MLGDSHMTAYNYLFVTWVLRQAAISRITPCLDLIIFVNF